MKDMSPSPAAVLALHGSASSGRQWHRLAEQLRGAATVIAPDIPGYGSATSCRADRLDHLTALLIAQPGPIHLVAHSLGATFALHLAHANPGRIASLTLYDPVTAIPDSRGGLTLPGGLGALCQYTRGPAETLMQHFFDFWANGVTWAALSADQRARLLRHHAGLCRDIDEITSGYWAIPQHTYRGPVILLCGAASPFVTRDVAHQIARTHPGTQLSVLPGLGHLSPLTEPDKVNAHLIAALARHGIALDRAHALAPAA